MRSPTHTRREEDDPADSLPQSPAHEVVAGEGVGQCPSVCEHPALPWLAWPGRRPLGGGGRGVQSGPGPAPLLWGSQALKMFHFTA